MSGAVIRDFQLEAAREARKAHKQPFVFFNEDEVAALFDRKTRGQFPNLGSYVPKGWKLVDRLFCDKYGWGSDHEPAMTTEQLRARIKSLLKENTGKTLGFGIEEEGEFQLYLGVYEKTTKTKKAS
jgi:hypothetical protein